MTAPTTSTAAPRYPGIRLTTNGNHLVATYTEARLSDGGVFYPITPSTEMGEDYQLSVAEGKLNVFGRSRIAIETEGEHSAQGGAIALSVTGKRVVNFTSGQGLVYGLEQYYHAPGKMSTMVVEVAARALTKHALNVHCGHDDVYAALDTGWIMLFAKDAQQAADQALILRRVTELSLTPGINCQDGFLTSHLERGFVMAESELIREYLGSPEDIIDCPTDAQRELFGPTRRRIPRIIDLENPTLIGPVQNQEHYMNGVVARRDNFAEHILGFLQEAYADFAELTGREYGLISQYKCDDAEVIYISLGSAAENIEAGVDYLRESRGAKVGSIHVNTLRPFPQEAIARALKGKKDYIVLERTDEALATDNPLAKEIRASLSRYLAVADRPVEAGLPVIHETEMPRNFAGVYGLGSRDFRPEHIIGAYEFVASGRKRQDGKAAGDGTSFFALGIDHPYAVVSDETPSLLPDNAIAIRLHSIGGWGMITTGKNLGEIIGGMGEAVALRQQPEGQTGPPDEVLHISANPKYGSEKKGAPTSYFLVVAPERVRVNCDLRHIDTVLCCDPKIFLHTNPLDGLSKGGAFIWESDETPQDAWERIPSKYRAEIIEKKIRLYTLKGFDIARDATDRPELQLRMQGNAFLGAFFRVSTFLDDYKIDRDQFRSLVHDQYVKKFGKFGDAVVDSNMEVMTKGFELTTKIPYGEIDAPDRSSMRGTPNLPLEDCGGCGTNGCDVGVPAGKAPLQTMKFFDSEFRAGLGYDQPASALSSIGLVAAATGETTSKYVARRQTPVFIAENCTQCMECIAVCPDTAMPNTAQNVTTVLETGVDNYVGGVRDRDAFRAAMPHLSETITNELSAVVKAKESKPFADVAREAIAVVEDVTDEGKEQLNGILAGVPMAYSKSHAIFKAVEKKDPGNGGLFSIFINDRCKGCGECVVACGDHDALKMVPDTEALNTDNATANTFLDLLPETPTRYLGLYKEDEPEESKPATLRNHLMTRRNYEAFLSGDGACAGCGEKSILRAVATLTEAYMRPIFHDKADRLRASADLLEKEGAARLIDLAKRSPLDYGRLHRAASHLIMGFGGETDADTDTRLAANGPITDAQLLEALVAVLREDARLHKDAQTIDGKLGNGMSVMAMGAHTGCNTVYSSTPPANPHPYPWMNSLFQDGATIGNLMGESFIMDHARRSVVPERLAASILGHGPAMSEAIFFELAHMTDALMTDREVVELPKVWVIGGDGGMGDIGFQNVSKVVLQNRPNVKLLMLDTQVYSNTGGQNSDSSPMPGGFDMNQFGVSTEGKMTEKKSVAEILTVGHGSPFVAQVSIVNAAKMFKSILDALEYRGAAFFQCFTTCQPEHGVGDDMAAVQAQRIRDSRGMPEFVFRPENGESYCDAMDLKGNPSVNRDWWQTAYKSTKEPYQYTTAHWAATEARFRRHLKKITEEKAAGLIPLDEMLVRLTQQDIIHHRYRDETSRAFVPLFGVYIKVENEAGKISYMSLSRHMVLFCVERRKAWRQLQSRAGITSDDRIAQESLIKKVDAGKITQDDLLGGALDLFTQELTNNGETKAAEAKPSKPKAKVPQGA